MWEKEKCSRGGPATLPGTECDVAKVYVEEEGELDGLSSERSRSSRLFDVDCFLL